MYDIIIIENISAQPSKLNLSLIQPLDIISALNKVQKLRNKLNNTNSKMWEVLITSVPWFLQQIVVMGNKSGCVAGLKSTCRDYYLSTN